MPRASELIVVAVEGEHRRGSRSQAEPGSPLQVLRGVDVLAQARLGVQLDGCLGVPCGRPRPERRRELRTGMRSQ
jgi:hypothetical protein